MGHQKQGKEIPFLKVSIIKSPSKVIHQEIINGWQLVFIIEAYMALTIGFASENILIKKGKSNLIGKYKSVLCMCANVCRDRGGNCWAVVCVCTNVWRDRGGNCWAQCMYLLLKIMTLYIYK